jgi:surface antigen
MLTKRRRLVNLVLTLALLLMACSAALFLMPTKAAKADSGDNYPYKSATNVGFSEWGYSTCPTGDTNCKVSPLTQVYNGVTYGLADQWGYAFRNCTSWAAWAVHDRDGVDVPHGLGNADTWASRAANDGISVDTTTSTGAVAQWAGAVAQWNDASWNYDFGHVAWIETVNSSTSITIEEYNGQVDNNGKPTGVWSTQTLTEGGSSQPLPWPDNVIYFGTIAGSGGGSPTPSTPFAIVRDTNDIDLAYNDNNNLVWYYHWNADTGWSHLNWADNAAGQPCVVAPDSTDLFFFYRSTTGKLMTRTWNETTGVWTGPTAQVNSGVDGDPSCVSRDPNDVQAFYLSDNGSVKSISWASGTWNTTPQTLYTSGATNDSYAISRNSDSMEVFFGKNNGNLVHVYWSAEHGWQTEDFSAGAGVTGKPSCIVRNSGNDMSCYYQENGNSKVAEEFWNVTNGWGWQDWTASLAGSPSAVVGVTNTIDDFYRESGGNIVDRSFGSSGWVTNNIVGTNGATGNPNAISRGGFDEEVFYWNGSALMDAHYDTTNQAWSTSQLN